MASQFTEWMEKYKKVTESVKGVPLVDIKEVMSVGGKNFVLSMGKENSVKDDEQEIDPKFMRSYYTNNKEVFGNVLDMLEARAREQRAFALNICNALTEAAVPEVVMARMRGDKDVSGDAFDMIKLGARKKMVELASIARNIKTPLATYNITIPTGGRFLTLHREFSLATSTVSWTKGEFMDGEFNDESPQLTMKLHDTVMTGDDIETCMFFLTNIELIKTDLVDLGKKLANVLE